MYLTIEGIDTVGKTTQIELLKKKFPQGVFTKEPGGSTLGKTIRELVLGKNSFSPTAEFLLFLADRSEHIEKVIKPNLNNLIVSDRSLISGIAYADDTIATKSLIDLNLFATDNTLPEKAFLLTTDKETLAKRLGAKTHDNIEAKGVDFLLSIQERLKKAARDLGIELIEIKADLSIETIHQKILEHIDE